MRWTCWYSIWNFFSSAHVGTMSIWSIFSGFDGLTCFFSYRWVLGRLIQRSCSIVSMCGLFHWMLFSSFLILENYVSISRNLFYEMPSWEAHASTQKNPIIQDLFFLIVNFKSGESFFPCFAASAEETHWRNMGWKGGWLVWFDNTRLPWIRDWLWLSCPQNLFVFFHEDSSFRPTSFLMIKTHKRTSSRLHNGEYTFRTLPELSYPSRRIADLRTWRKNSQTAEIFCCANENWENSEKKSWTLCKHQEVFHHGQFENAFENTRPWSCTNDSRKTLEQSTHRRCNLPNMDGESWWSCGCKLRKGQARGNLPHRSKKRAPRSSKKTRRSRNLPSHAPKLERSLSGKQNKMLDLLPKHSPCDASRANKTSLRHTGVPPTDGHSKVRDTNSPWKNPQNFFFLRDPQGHGAPLHLSNIMGENPGIRSWQQKTNSPDPKHIN